MQQADSPDIDFTGEFFVPGKSGERIEQDHLERYRFATAYGAGKDVLDIACGVGYSAPMFIAGGAKSYLGVDLNEKQIRYAASNYGDGAAEFAVGDICRFSPGRLFDLICCFETIEHVANYRDALHNLRRLVNRGGLLLVSSPNRPITSPNAASLSDRPSNEFHTQEFTPEELIAELRSAGFEASINEVFGQRLRQHMPSWRLNQLKARILGNPDEVSSPSVTPLNGKQPRYFVVVAKAS